jgi:hypothetical protein
MQNFWGFKFELFVGKWYLWFVFTVCLWIFKEEQKTYGKQNDATSNYERIIKTTCEQPSP